MIAAFLTVYVFFRLLLFEHGEEIGTFATANPSWHEGDEVLVRPGERWRIRSILPSPPNELDLHGVWEVERLTPTAPDE
jgi:hypothetical protein